ncbi:MAG: bifunctional 5,10-methylenetetrahydrofolate dehydrogenase/5,10-methenyltetrahydrofolate cyclohydrolase, partial [Candidatus Levybacteria bacterium]|nr:bifunctional 5,10-methylenetetrahydrofolate dehydrogenase/5,10-methenyltetrahydrofolate cyclohydrolase [Candidatus Levybacteria bacterium]
MKIDGRRIAEEIRNELKSYILQLKNQGIVPKIAIITLGPESSWETYVRQKIKVARELGIKTVTVLINLEDSDEEKLIRTIREIDKDPNYHGIIVQRPIPPNFNRERVVNSISPKKDVDGFRPDSKFEVPVWLAVKKILESRIMNYESWRELNFVVLGKGETAGGPIIRGLKKMGLEPQIIDSRTTNPVTILKNADIIISCVGKIRVVSSKNIKKGVILIGV